MAHTHGQLIFANAESFLNYVAANRRDDFGQLAFRFRDDPCCPASSFLVASPEWVDAVEKVVVHR
jgi:hypothetical protein